VGERFAMAAGYGAQVGEPRQCCQANELSQEFFRS
jgi:hypothetical protein